MSKCILTSQWNCLSHSWFQVSLRGLAALARTCPNPPLQSTCWRQGSLTTVYFIGCMFVQQEITPEGVISELQTGNIFVKGDGEKNIRPNSLTSSDTVTTPSKEANLNYFQIYLKRVLLTPTFYSLEEIIMNTAQNIIVIKVIQFHCSLVKPDLKNSVPVHDCVNKYFYVSMHKWGSDSQNLVKNLFMFSFSLSLSSQLCIIFNKVLYFPGGTGPDGLLFGLRDEEILPGDRQRLLLLQQNRRGQSIRNQAARTRDSFGQRRRRILANRQIRWVFRHYFGIEMWVSG